MTNFTTTAALLLVVAASTAAAANPRVPVCHLLPSDYAWQTIHVPNAAVNTHLDHGDMIGACGDLAESLCSDAHFCTVDAFLPGTEQCVAAGARPPADCDDGDPSTADACDPESGCINTPMSLCGDGMLNQPEEFDPPPGPFASAPVSSTSCRYDFSEVPQLYCYGSCNWGGAEGCDQIDADLFCKLKTDNSASTATSFTTTRAMDAPGFACPFHTHAATTVLGATFRSVTPASGPVRYQDSSILASHGSGLVVDSVVCADP